MQKGFSASTVKSWFQYRCERKVRYELSSEQELDAVPVSREQGEAAWVVLGNEYEARVVRRLSGETRVLLPAHGEDALTERRTAAFLRGEGDATHAAQANLRPSRDPAFLAGTDLRLNRNLADLVRREPRSGRPALLTLIDVKATRRATAFHKTQVAFYARVLDSLLAEVGGSGAQPATVSPQGEIWRIPDDGTADGDDWQIETFALAPYLRLVDEFCRDTLPRIASKRVGRDGDDTFFHVYFKCEQCRFLPHCSKAVEPGRGARRDVSAVPGLTHEAKRALHRLDVATVPGLSRAAGLAQAAGVGWSLARRAPILVERARAMVAGTARRTAEEHTFLMPPRADVALMLSVDHDTIDDRIAAIGYRRVDAGMTARERVVVPRSPSLAEEAEALVAVLGALISDLSDVDARNAAGTIGSGQGVFAHIFFYEPAEAVTLQRAVGRHLGDERIRNGLLHLVRLFPPDDVVPEPEFRGVHHLPATAVRSVVEQLWALPVTVAYDLRQVSQALEASGVDAAYRPESAFERPFSSMLSIDVIRKRNSGATDAVTTEAVERDVRARLDALQGVVAWLFDQHQKSAARGEPLLRLAKRPFRFQATLDPLNAIDLDVLTACELLENRAGLLEALVNLAQPASRRRDAGRCVAGMTLRKHWAYGRSRILLFDVPAQARETDLGPGDWDLILTDDDPGLRLDMALWPDLSCRIRPASDGWEERRGSLQVDVAERVFSSDTFQDLMRRAGPGRWHLDRGFHDVNTGKTTRFLAYLRRGGDV